MKATLFSLLLLGTTCQAEVGLVIGGFGATDTVQVVTKDAVCLGSQSNPVIAKAPDGRFGWVAQYVDGQIVLCGGAKTDIYKDCFTFSIGSAWRPLGMDMTYAKRYAESLVFNGEMMVLGGYNERQGWLDAVEKLTSGGWQEMEPWKMPRKIFDFCAVQMDSTRIMVLGGNVLGEFDSDNMEILDTSTGTWSTGPSMARRRATHDCLVTEHNGEKGVMVTGGCSQNCYLHLTDTSFFSFATQTWTELAPLNQGRMGHALLLIDGKPTVIGGFDHSELDSVEVFDGTEWKMHPDKMSFATYVSGSVAVPETVTC